MRLLSCSAECFVLPESSDSKRRFRTAPVRHEEYQSFTMVLFIPTNRTYLGIKARSRHAGVRRCEEFHNLAVARERPR